MSASVPPGDQPEEGQLRGNLYWDAGNRKHLAENCRLSEEQVEYGIYSGYVFLREDKHYEGRYHYGFEPLPDIEDAIFTLVIDTNAGSIRPVTVFKETEVKLLNIYKQARRRGEME